MNELSVILRAVHFAADKHRDQRRKDVEASPYINHPIAVAQLLAEVGGVHEVATLVAAILHDTVEDTETTHEELVRVFGEEIAGIVAEVTDDATLPGVRRKRLQVEHAPQLSRPAKLVKLADKLCNVADVLERPPADWSERRKSEYIAWATEVVAGLRGTCEPLERRFDGVIGRAGSSDDG